MSEKCDCCQNTSTRNLGETRPGPTKVCEIHYAEVDDTRHERAERKIGVPPNEVPRCELCGTRSLNKRGTNPRLISHHVCYGHDTTVELCDSCHAKVHNDPDHKLQPHDSKLHRGTAEANDYPEPCEYTGILEGGGES